MTLYDNRKLAGQELKNLLKEKTDVDLVVVPYPESFDVAIQVADIQDAETKLLLSDFISSPTAPYAEFGAITEDGTLWIDDNLKDELGVSKDYIRRRSEELSRYLKKKSVNLEENKKFDGKGLKVLIVSDGIGSGFREAAVAGSLLKQGVERIDIATPFITRGTKANLGSVVDRVFYLHEIPFMSSSEALYEA